MKNSSAASSTESDTLQLDKLLKGCTYSINQCDYLLQQITEKSYIHRSESASSIGAHMRHLLDRYHCFFAGLGDGSVDYDARKRDQGIQTNLEAARFAVASVARRLQDLQVKGGETLRVRESVHHLSSKVVIDSTVSRELMGLITHTTHHLAIIGMIARDLGYSLDRDFGKAPSTLIFESS